MIEVIQEFARVKPRPDKPIAVVGGIEINVTRTDTGLHPPKHQNYKGGTRKRVMQFTREGKWIESWPSASAAARALRVSSTAIINCCNGRDMTLVKGYRWKYDENN